MSTGVAIVSRTIVAEVVVESFGGSGDWALRLESNNLELRQLKDVHLDNHQYLISWTLVWLTRKYVIPD